MQEGQEQEEQEGKNQFLRTDRLQKRKDEHSAVKQEKLPHLLAAGHEKPCDRNRNEKQNQSPQRDMGAGIREHHDRGVHDPLMNQSQKKTCFFIQDVPPPIS